MEGAGLSPGESSMWRAFVCGECVSLFLCQHGRRLLPREAGPDRGVRTHARHKHKHEERTTRPYRRSSGVKVRTA